MTGPQVRVGRYTSDDRTKLDASGMTEQKYVLVVVTNGGIVSSSVYPSLYAAQQAKSIALTGMTIEDKRAHDMDREAARKEWYATHPPRSPKNDDERRMVQSRALSGIRVSLGSNHNGVTVTADGLIQEHPPWSDVFISLSGDDYAHGIRCAVYFADAGDTDKLDRT